ncbi:hypothetical protein [Pseudomonas faucium]|uniref:hypothetical protein n=1 Tax=Pseudomonas faucium TaxID=2740518 RepID=UPI0015964A8C|nr:hypothetical protein [Pseudomonas faucium]
MTNNQVAADEEAPAESVVPASVTFRDKTHTSRTLILGNSRELYVVAGSVTVQASDKKAMGYLVARSDFERVKE